MVPGFLSWGPTEGLLALVIPQSRWVHLVGRDSARTLQTFRAILSARRGLRNPLVPEFLWHLQYDPFTGYLVLFWVCKGQTNFGITNSAVTLEVLKLLTFLLVHPSIQARIMYCALPGKCPFPSTQKVVSSTPSACCLPASTRTTVLPGDIPKLPHAACALCQAYLTTLCPASPQVPCIVPQLPTHPFAWPQSWNSDRDSSVLFAIVSWCLAKCLRLTVLYKYLKNEHMSNLTVSKL